MKYHEVKISIGRTINMGNFESARVDVSLSAILEEGDKIDDVIARIKTKCNNELNIITNGDVPYTDSNLIF